TDRIRAIGETNGSHGAGAADLPGQLGVRNGAATCDFPQFTPDAALKNRSSRLYGQAVYRVDIPGEITLHRVSQAMRIACRFETEPVLSIVQLHEPQHAGFVLRPVNGA